MCRPAARRAPKERTDEHDPDRPRCRHARRCRPAVSWLRRLDAHRRRAHPLRSRLVDRRLTLPDPGVARAAVARAVRRAVRRATLAAYGLAVGRMAAHLA